MITQKAAFDSMKKKDAIIISRNEGPVIDVDRERKLKHLQKFKKGCSLLYPITHIAASSDLSVVYIARESQLEVWERTGNDSFAFVKNLCGHSKPITSVYYNEDRQMLVSSDTSSKILFWKGNKTNAKLQIIQSTRPRQVVPSCMVLFSGRRRLFVGTKEGKMLRYDQKEGRSKEEDFFESGTYNGQVGFTALAITSAEDLLVAGTQGGFIFVWETLEDRFGEYDLQVGSPSTQISDVRVEPSGRFIVAGSIDASIKVFKRDQGGEYRQFQVLGGHIKVVNKMLVGIKGTMFISASSDTTIGVWKQGTSGRFMKVQEVQDFYREPITSLVYDDKSETLIAGGLDGQAHAFGYGDDRRYTSMANMCALI